MRCILCAILSSIVFTLFINLTYGQENKAVKSNTTVKKKVIYREKSYYDFEETLINGNLREPDGSFIFRRSESEFNSALGLKRSFIPELEDSAKEAR